MFSMCKLMIKKRLRKKVENDKVGLRATSYSIPIVAKEKIIEP